MDVVEDRDPAFWGQIAGHPEVAPHVSLGLSGLDIAAIVSHPSVSPLRAAHGGFLFCRIDGLGRVLELHTLFTPEGWGREVLAAAKSAFSQVFEAGAQVVTTYEVEGWWRSRPPRSFGFRPAGPFAPTVLGPLRSWILTADAWEVSPARRRME